MKKFARNSLLLAAVVAVASINVPQAMAQSCQSSGSYYPIRRAYHPPRKLYVPVRQVAHVEQHVHVQPQPPVNAGMQLIDLRLVDPGAPGQAGPKIRVVFQNANPFAASAPFDIVLAAAINEQFQAELPLAGQRVTEIAPGETAVVDLRLPPAALEMQYPGEVRPAPFQNLIVMVARARNLQGQPQFEQLAVIPRLNLRLVDMRIDPAAQAVAPAGAVITLSGEGFGTQPGQAVFAIGGLKLAGEVVNWSPQGVQVRLPQLALAEAVPAEITLIRADTAVAAMGLQITPAVAAVQETATQVPLNAGTPQGAAVPQQGFNPQTQGQVQAQQGVAQQGQAQAGLPIQLPGLGVLQGQGPVK
ncbi:MAG: hypothetical protein MPJ50_06575 [Pirellulales bacterium]|nr:hypothetical protein [Pirellulales bacterium]